MYNLQLETFIVVEDLGSFNKAAEALYITPPAVTKQINLLEKDLGLKLFIRTHRGLVLTEAGKSLYTTRIYAVEVFSKGRENDSQTGKDAEEYAEYCEAAGWQLIDGRRRFCIFRRVQDDAVPIVTEEERFQNVKKAEIRHFLDRSAGFALLAGMDWLQFFTINFDRWVFSQTWLLLLAGLTFMCLFYLLQLGGLFVWSCRAKRELESRGSIYYGQRKRIRAANEIWTLVIMGSLYSVRETSWTEAVLLCLSLQS